ncbi:protein of unknown function [Thauera humireducens]|nr:protein of unknown function [Thauera humireducens]
MATRINDKALVVYTGRQRQLFGMLLVMNNQRYSGVYSDAEIAMRGRKLTLLARASLGAVHIS